MGQSQNTYRSPALTDPKRLAIAVHLGDSGTHDNTFCDLVDADTGKKVASVFCFNRYGLTLYGKVLQAVKEKGYPTEGLPIDPATERLKITDFDGGVYTREQRQPSPPIAETKGTP